jgi:hypothetical protein
VAFEYHGKYFYVGSHDQSNLLQDLKVPRTSRTEMRVSLVIEYLHLVDPWRPCGIKVRGAAEVIERDGMFGKGSYLRISPQVTIS